ncbi:MAG: 16S rRNA (guanine(966)-N(2))-methyltransferase RsmD [Ignavibacteria bacterium]|nr:16S rRNA (guanine(966)-N(2))-methyltransferase RsmD [Ignavibacteria bacterium]
MRIITGNYKGRILKSPDSNKVRPTSDRAKESLFNVLNNIVDFEEMTVLDLFCGTGSLGLECISRGARRCYFVDNDVNAVRKNIDILKLKDECEVLRSEVLNFLNRFNRSDIDIVFCDPPYDYERYSELIEKISLMKTILVLEHSGKFKLNDKFEEYVILKKKTGTVNFTFFDFK